MSLKEKLPFKIKEIKMKRDEKIKNLIEKLNFYKKQIKFTKKEMIKIESMIKKLSKELSK
jgi:chaperonin cofactor prefoldin